MTEMVLKYRIKEFCDALPRAISITSELQKKGINIRTFYRDVSIPLKSSQSISGDRLLLYADFFKVSIDQLLTKSIKAKKSKVKTLLK